MKIPLKLIQFFFILVFGMGRGNAQQQLAKYFEGLIYSDFFLLGTPTPADSLWAIPETKNLAEKLLVDTAASVKSRFFAAELLFTKNSGLPDSIDKFIVAKVYATALKEGFADRPNYWGMPDVDYGYIGSHVISLGPAAIKAFHPLLKDRRILRYSGSREATQSQLYQYRICDVAAMYIVAIHKKDSEYKPCRWLFIRRIQIARIKLIKS